MVELGLDVGAAVVVVEGADGVDEDEGVDPQPFVAPVHPGKAFFGVPVREDTVENEVGRGCRWRESEQVSRGGVEVIWDCSDKDTVSIPPHMEETILNGG